MAVGKHEYSLGIVARHASEPEMRPFDTVADAAGQPAGLGACPDDMALWWVVADTAPGQARPRSPHDIIRYPG